MAQMKQANVVREVVEVFGGRTEPIAAEVGVANSTVRFWLRIGRVPGSAEAVRLHESLRKRGHPISIARLAGVDSGPVNGGKSRKNREENAWMGDVIRESESIPPSDIAITRPGLISEAA